MIINLSRRARVTRGLASPYNPAQSRQQETFINDEYFIQTDIVIRDSNGISELPPRHFAFLLKSSFSPVVNSTSETKKIVCTFSCCSEIPLLSMIVDADECSVS